MNLATADLFHAEIARLQAEIELLRGYRDEAEAEASIASLAAQRLRLTDKEREAVEWFAAGDETCYGWGWKSRAATLRGLLERTAR